MRQIRLGVMGTGLAFERLHLPALQELKDQFRVVAVCDVDRFKAAAWGHKLAIPDDHVSTDYHPMLYLSDIDAFDIIVPIQANYQVTREVATAGKPIMCEKPLAPNPEEVSVDEQVTYTLV
ncbi:MAG: Gfo/Idh/MocA family oxidoreductase [Limnochordaceae bacterium]|nr:Gfo/Idh/MocA family oxidoreductase [Limnochordaceae bacterium]